jgi:hypothetical protein
MKTTITENGYVSFNEETLGDLIDKEGYAVCLGATPGTIKLPTTAAEAKAAIGVVHERHRPDDPEVSVRLFGAQGSMRARFGGGVAANAPVKVAVGGKFVTATSGNLAVGLSLLGEASANDSLGEVLLNPYII